MTAAALEYKTLPTGPDGTDALTGVIDHDDEHGTITAIVAVSGVRDEVGDYIVPGSLGKAIKRLRPKGVNNHDWGVKVSKMIYADELMPGDPRLPPRTAQGDPWPKEAGGLLVKAKYNLEKKEGRDAYADAIFYEDEESFSIGYKVRTGGAKKRGDTRYLHDYDIYEWSQVLHGANTLARLIGVKSLLDTVTPPDTWYDEDRSDTGSEGQHMEFKVRYVRDPEFWGLPYGTILRSGMKPRGERARAIRAQGRTPDPAEGTDTAAPGQNALLPEEGARRVKPRARDEDAEASDDPAADLVYALQGDDRRGEGGMVESILAEVLGDALTPSELEEELRDAAEGADIAEDDLRDTLDDYRRMYWDRLEEQTRTGRAGVDPGTRQRALDAAGEAIDDAHKERLAIALTALEDDNPKATAAWVLGGEYGRSARHKRFEIASEALKDGDPPRADDELTDTQLQEVTSALANDRDDEPEDSHEYDVLNEQFQAAYDLLAARDKGEPGPTPVTPSPGWGDAYIATPAYQTPDGPVWMFRKGQRTRFYDRSGRQVGPEQQNMAPATAYALDQGWTKGDAEPPATPKAEAAPKRAPLTTADYEKIKKNSHPDARDAALSKLTDVELAAVEHESRRRGKRAENMQDSARVEKIRRRQSPAQLRERADKAMESERRFLRDLRRDENDAKPDRQTRQFYARADDYERRDAAGIGRHDFDTLPYGEIPPGQEKPAAKPKAGRKPKKLSERLTAAVDRYNARAEQGRPDAAAKPSGRLRSAMAGRPGATSTPVADLTDDQLTAEHVRLTQRARDFIAHPTHPLSPKEYVAHRERALSRRFRREDIDRRNKEVDKERGHIERSRATAASAPAVIEDPPEGTVLVAGGRIALSNPGKATWKLQTAGGWTLTDARMFGASDARSAVKLNRTQAGQLAERIAALTDAQGNPVPTTVADRDIWVRGWRDAEGHDIQHAIHKIAAEWAAENGIAIPEHVRAAAGRPPRGEPRTAGAPDTEGFRPHETPRDVNPGDEVRLPDGSVHTVSGRRGPGKEGRVVLEFDDGTEHDFGSFGRVDVRYADDPDDTRDPGMGFEIHPDMGSVIGRFQPNVRESIEQDNPDPVPAGTRIIYTPQRSALHGDYDDRRPRVGTVTDRYVTVAGDWFQVIDYDDGTADAIRTRNLVKSGALVLDPVPEQIDAALREWGPDSERPGTGTPAKPEINLSRLGDLDDTALSTALDDARRKHRTLVENGVPRNSAALHDAKRAATMLEDELRRRGAVKPAILGPMSHRDHIGAGAPQLRKALSDAAIRGASRITPEQRQAIATTIGYIDQPPAPGDAPSAPFLPDGMDPSALAGELDALADNLDEIGHQRTAVDKRYRDREQYISGDLRKMATALREPKPDTTEPPPPASDARQARLDADDAIADQDRDALADTLTRLGVGTGDDGRDPHEVAGGLLAIPTDVQQQRLDRLEQAAAMVAEPGPFRYAEPTAEELAMQDDVPDDSPLARVIAEENEQRAARLAAWNRPATTVAAPEVPAEIESETPSDTVTVTRRGKRFVFAFSKLPGRTFGPYEFAEAVRDLRVSALLSPVDARNLVMDAGANGVAEKRTGGSNDEPEAVIPSAVQADAEVLRGDTLGLTEAEDGELEVTEEVAQRQDRVTALLDSGPADLGERTDDELGGTRRDLVDELALQEELRRRDVARRQEAAARRATEVTESAPPADDATTPAEPAKPRVRPGLTGALDDLADALNEHGVTAADHETVRAATDRLTTVLRRNRSDSEVVTELRALLGDDPSEAIRAGRVRPGVLLGLSERMRQEARDRRNAAARARRLARRIERDRIRSLIGQVDVELRRRGRDPHEYGGAVAGVQAQSEPDMGDLAQHQRPADLVAEDQAIRDRTARAIELIREARQASEGGDHARAVDLMEQAQAADPSRADRMTEMRNRFAVLRDEAAAGERAVRDGTPKPENLKLGDRFELDRSSFGARGKPITSIITVVGHEKNDRGVEFLATHSSTQGEGSVSYEGFRREFTRGKIRMLPPEANTRSAAPAEPGDMTDEQLRATDARMDEERRASGARSITEEHRTIKAELGRRSSVAARSASAKRGAETRARRQAAGLPPKRQPLTLNKPPTGEWTYADLTEQGLTRALDDARREYRQAHDAGAPNTEAAKARHDALLAEKRRRTGEAPETLEPAIRLEDLHDGTLNQLKVTVDRGRFAMAIDDGVQVGTIVRRSGGSATFTPDDGDPIELTARHRIRGALLTADDKISPQYAFAERMAAGFRPARYTEVNADTGETTERPDLARPAEETRLIDLAREFRAALERGEFDTAQERIDSARDTDPGNPRWDDFQTELDTRRASVEPPASELTAGEQATERSRQARQAFDDDEPDRALELVEQARALDPGRHRLWDKIRRHIETHRPPEKDSVTVDELAGQIREEARAEPGEGGDDGPPAAPNRDAVPPAPPEPEDQEPGRVLPPPDERGDGRGPGSGGRTAGGRPAGGRDAGPRDARTGGGARPERPARGAGTTTTEPRGSGDRRGAGGVREREAGTAEPDQPLSGFSEADQPTPDSETVDAIPGDGPRFRPDGVDDFAPPGERAKLNANMAALRTLRRLQDDPGRPATSEEQATLARWAGWGGLPDVFEERASKRDRYATERAELQELLSPAEYRAAERNTLNAHYTDARAVQAMWQVVQDLGFDGGRVLEPGSGSGNFIGFAPEEARMTGVEVDPITAAISRYLYPDADIRNESFGKTNIPEGTFDLTIGNVPFGDFPVADRRYNPGNKSIHNHFIHKSLAQTKPGGLVAVLTSRHTMDARNDRERRRFAEMADLVGAVRLPTGSHLRASGTKAIEDILIFRRREPGAEPRGDQSWINSTKRDLDGFEIPVNDYWAAHPGHVLGEMRGEKGRYGGDIVVKGDRDMPDLPGVLAAVVEQAKADGLTAIPHDPDRETYEIASSEHHEGRIGLDADGNWTQVSGGAERPLDVPDAQREELRALAGLRDTRRALLRAEAATGEDSPALRDLRADLNDRYDTYVERYGPINRFTRTRSGARKQPPVMPLWRRDPMASIVRALETYDPDSGQARKADVFRKRVAAPREIPDSADTPADAIALSLDTWGEVRLPEIARWLGTDEADAREQLGGLVYEQPPLSEAENEAAWRRQLDTSGLPEIEGRFGRLPFEQGDARSVDLLGVGESIRQEGRLEPAAAYLSGNVRRKLAAARAAAEHDSRFKANVDALERVVPVDLTPQEIEGRLGAAWIAAEDVQEFLADLLELDNTYGGRKSARVSASGGGLWNVEAPDWNILATETWGTRDRSAPELIQALLEQRPIKITRTVEGPDGKKKQVPDLDATLAAQEKAEAIAERFSEWLWEDPDRSARLQTRYNNHLNALVLRDYSGERTFPGMAAEYTPRPHQVAAVNRAVAEPAALFGHVVGAGKTGEMVMTAMEWKRLGLVNKPAIVVPNHMLEQFEREFLEIYPNANILAAGTDDLAGDKRREFVARAAGDDYDAVILTQGAFEAIPVGEERMRAYIDRELADMRRQMKEAEASLDPDEEKKGKSAKAKTVKRMQAALAKAEAALEAKLDKVKDDGVSWEETGIDGLLVDEAHHYSNLRTLSNIPGAGATGSDKATDLHMKIEDIRATNPTARLVFATGTPIRNTITQAYIMQRFQRPDLLKQAGIHSFDQWAATFGKIIEEMELKPEGTGFRQSARFAKFQNVPELLQMFRIFADIKLAADLDLPTPALAGGKAQTVTVGRTDQTAAFIRDLGRRAELIRAGKPELRLGAGGKIVEDNMLLVSMDGRKAALSMRLVGGHHEPGKIEMAADRIHAKWEATKDKRYPLDSDYPDMGDDPTPGALQLAFLDMGTPSGKSGIEQREEYSTEASVPDWNAYAELKTQLVARGMDPKSIRFIHEAKNDTERAEMFAAARAGRIAVLVGSTEKMGTGVNVQRRAVALHHLDAPWRPSDVEQRDGRVMRQGNLNPEIEIVRYVSEGTFDAYMWQTLERKAKFINQILSGSLHAREIEDVGDNALSYAEVKALATGNPDLMELAKIDTLRSKLERLARTHETTQTGLRTRTSRYRNTITRNEADIIALGTAIEQRTDISGDKFVATIGSERYATRTDANVDLNRRLWEAMNGFSKGRTQVGSLAGFDLYAQPTREPSGGWGVELTLDGVPHPVVTYGHKDLGEGKVNTIVRIENTLAGLESHRKWKRKDNVDLAAEIDAMEPRIGLSFARTDELNAARRKSDRLRQKMILDARRLDGKDIPFDPQIDSARFDSALVGGGTAADAPPDPGGLIEQAEWERAWELRRAQAAAERADAPTPMETALAKVRAALEPGAAHVAGGRNTLQRFAEIAGENPDAIHASPSGRIIATRRKDGGWVAYDASTGLNLSAPTWARLDFQGDVYAALAELEELKIPWGDAPLQEAKRNARGSYWGTQVVKSALEVWRRHADPEEKSLVGVISPIDTLRARRLRDDLETTGLRGFA